MLIKTKKESLTTFLVFISTTNLESENLTRTKWSLEIMENEIKFVSDYVLGKLCNKMAYVVATQNDLPLYMVKARGKSGRLSKRIFATIKSATKGNVPQPLVDALFKDADLQSDIAKAILSKVQVEDLKPSVKVKAKTSTKSKPIAKVIPKEESTEPAINAFAKSLEVNMKAMDQEDEQSDLINSMLELAKS